MSTRLWLSIGAVVATVAAGIFYYRSDVAAEAPTLSTAEVTEVTSLPPSRRPERSRP